MRTKVFEVRDRGTFIPVLATRLSPYNNQEEFLLGRAGFGQRWPDQKKYVIVSHLSSGNHNYNMHSWGNRTMQEAHRYIQENFDTLEHGEVIDVEYILGESTEPKKSERTDNG